MNPNLLVQSCEATVEILGERLASAAINIAYGKVGTFTGPTLSGAFETTNPTKNE